MTATINVGRPCRPEQACAVPAEACVDISYLTRWPELARRGSCVPAYVKKARNKLLEGIFLPIYLPVSN